jgi:mannose-1-phosphate guanylyltransferase
VKAYLLAAGLGSRLRPLTDSVPKCLLPVGGEPLLGRWLRACRRHGVGEVLVNTHHLAGLVSRWVEGPGRKYGLHVELFHEERLLGSAGTVRAARDFAAGEESFFIIYADNVSEVDLGRMSLWHGRHRGVMTVGLFRAPRPERCGVAKLDGEGRVTRFEEKPARPASPWASAGIYVARPALFDRLEETREDGRRAGATLDFGYDVLPRLALRGDLHGYRIEEFLMDIGTPESYAAASSHLTGRGD